MTISPPAPPSPGMIPVDFDADTTWPGVPQPEPEQDPRPPTVWATITAHAWELFREVLFYYSVLILCGVGAYLITHDARAFALFPTIAPVIVGAVLAVAISDLRKGEAA